MGRMVPWINPVAWVQLITVWRQLACSFAPFDGHTHMCQCLWRIRAVCSASNVSETNIISGVSLTWAMWKDITMRDGLFQFLILDRHPSTTYDSPFAF